MNIVTLLITSLITTHEAPSKNRSHRAKEVLILKARGLRRFENPEASPLLQLLHNPIPSLYLNPKYHPKSNWRALCFREALAAIVFSGFLLKRGSLQIYFIAAPTPPPPPENFTYHYASCNNSHGT